MPALIVFLAGAALMLTLVCLGPQIGIASVAGLVIGLIIRPLVVGLIQNW